MLLEGMGKKLSQCCYLSQQLTPPFRFCCIWNIRLQIQVLQPSLLAFAVIAATMQEQPVFLISRLLLRMCRMYVASIRLDCH